VTWTIRYLPEALQDLRALDSTRRARILKAIEKVSRNPLPNSEGGYGKPLGNRRNSRLAGYLKIRLLKDGLRVVYGLVRDKEVMKIIVISVREDDFVYHEAGRRA
jgi:mRNA interferase RelE/StbE